jgi:hypothetical protein
VVDYRCQENCDGWKNMINFIWGVPHYSIADLCCSCDVWYPKHVLLRCPCCNRLLRRARQRSNSTCKKSSDVDTEMVRKKLEAALASGWTLLKPEIWKAILDYRLAHKLPLK